MWGGIGEGTGTKATYGTPHIPMRYYIVTMSRVSNTTILHSKYLPSLVSNNECHFLFVCLQVHSYVLICYSHRDKLVVSFYEIPLICLMCTMIDCDYDFFVRYFSLFFLVLFGKVLSLNYWSRSLQAKEKRINAP